MRTAYFCDPYTCTCATPLTMEMRWAIRVSPYSSRVDSGSVGEVRATYRMGWSAGFTLRNEGGLGMSGGSWPWATEMADCTSCAAASRSRARSNCRVMVVTPWKLLEVMDEMPAMVENCFSRGVATAEAMVSGLAPGRLAVTLRVGKSTLGRSDTGRFRYPARPKMRIARVTSVVMIGRRMNSADRFMSRSSRRRRPAPSR